MFVYYICAGGLSVGMMSTHFVGKKNTKIIFYATGIKFFFNFCILFLSFIVKTVCLLDLCAKINLLTYVYVRYVYRYFIGIKPNQATNGL